MSNNNYNKAEQERQLIRWYQERNKLLAEIVRELAGEKATRIMAKKFDVSTQAVNLLYPLPKKGDKA